MLIENKTLNRNFYQDEILKRIDNGKLRIDNLEKYLLDLRKQVALYTEEKSFIEIKKENITQEELKKKLNDSKNKLDSVNCSIIIIGLLIIIISGVLSVFLNKQAIFEFVSNIVMFLSYVICFIGMLFLISIIRNGVERKLTFLDIIGNKFYKRTSKR